MNTLNDMTLAGIRAYYANGGTPTMLMTELRQKALSYADHHIFIHMLSEQELAPWIDQLEAMDPDSTPLWGVPFVLKDNIDLAGIPTTAACERFSYRPEHSAFVVQRLLDQGALPLGKANLDQFATGLNGTRSPWGACGNSFDHTYISGGSSSGSAVSVALGLASFSLGTDTAGSGRVPAGFNNLVGMKPTRGLLSAQGVVPACKSLDCVSIFALHTDDAHAVLSVAEGFDAKDSYSRQNPYDNLALHYGRHAASLTVGVLPGDQLKFFGDKAYAAAYAQALAQLDDAGVSLVDVDYTPFDEVARLLYEGPWVAERYLATQPLIDDEPEAMFPVVRQIIAGGGEPKAADLFRAQYRLAELKRHCDAQLAPLDVLLTPTAGRLFTIEEMLTQPVEYNSALGYYMNFVNLLDLSAVAIPAGFTEQGLPFGVTLCAPAFHDRHVLSVGNRLQQIFDLPLGAMKQPASALTDKPVSRDDSMILLVCGAHMQGMPLNHQLTDRGGVFLEKTQTSANYRLFALNETPLSRPALLRSTTGGRAIEVELWRVPGSEVGSFLQGIAAPLGLGQVQLVDGRQVCGFIAEGIATDNAREVTAYGGWRAYLADHTPL